MLSVVRVLVVELLAAVVDAVVAVAAVVALAFAPYGRRHRRKTGNQQQKTRAIVHPAVFNPACLLPAFLQSLPLLLTALLPAPTGPHPRPLWLG